MSTVGFVAISIVVLLASIVYELTVISRFITEQKLKRQPQDDVPAQIIQHREYLTS